MNQRIQEPPFTIKIEFTEGCNLRCKFCGLQGIRAVGDKTYKFMTPATLQFICDQIRKLGWNSRIELTRRGEPTMNPRFIEMIGIMRRTLPHQSIMLTSNGAGFLFKQVEGDTPARRVRQAFDAGLNVLCLDDYQDANLVPRIRKDLADTHWDFCPVYEYPDERSGKPNPYARQKPTTKIIAVFKDITLPQKGGARTHLSNHCGGAAPLNESKQGKRCARPFRELAVNFDGNVPICCNDWRGVFKGGNILDIGLNAVWQSAGMDAARRKLYRGERDFGPCRGCDSHSHRAGILPDPQGLDTMPVMDEEAQRALKAACDGPSYTLPVLRDWEQPSCGG